MAIEAVSGIDKQGTGAFGTPGEIRQQCGSTIPAGWMVCEGQLLAVADYPLLFAAIGDTFGGDGTTNFALPNYRTAGSGARKIICVDSHASPPVLQVNVPASIHGPAPGYYKAGAVLSFALQLLEDIAITGGPVRLTVDIGGSAHTQAFVSGTAREWVFADYTVQAGDSGELTAAINLNGATLSSGGIAAVLSTSSLINATVDTTAPTITFSAIKFSIDSGSSGTDFVTSSASQTITATLSGMLSTTEEVWGSLDNGGVWVNLNNRLSGTSLIWDNVTLTGSSTLKFKVTDLAGNDGPVASQAYVLDASEPATPTITLATDSGSSGSDGITNVGTVNVGDLEAGATWRRSTDGGTTWSSGTGSSFTLSAGTYAAGSIKVEQTDIAGNVSAIGSNADTITVDTTAPATPTITLATDSGSSGSDGITNVGTVNVGDLEAGATWRRSTDGGTTWSSGTGSSFTLSAGTYAAGSIKVEQTDIAGNVSAIGSNADTITVDTTAPATPTVNALTTSTTTPTITGTATVGAGEVLTVVVNSVTYTAGGADLTLSGTGWSLVIPAGNTLAVGTYSVTATVTDTAGNATSDSTSAELVITA